jgi:aldose 1-epimerase
MTNNFSKQRYFFLFSDHMPASTKSPSTTRRGAARGHAAPGRIDAQVLLRCGGLRAAVAPAIGGSLSAFYSLTERPGGEPLRHDWLRPAEPAGSAAPEAQGPLGMASFPLLPWCNRIRDGRFAWRGRTVQLPPNFADSRHTIHGVGWQVPWQLDARGEHRVSLRLHHRGDARWPFAFEARQCYTLDAHGLSIEIELVNTGEAPMPAGLGHHPYFAHRREGCGTRVQAEVGAIWQSDTECLPLALSATHPAVAALRGGLRLGEHVLDNNFTGFARTARVDWPDGRALTMRASAPLDHFVLYSPADRDTFCMEAVSNCTDWINLRARDPSLPVGGHVLAPGETLTATIRFEPVAA